MTLTYVYCLVRSTRPPAVRVAPAALPGARPVRALAAGERTWAIVSSVPPAQYGEAQLAEGLRNLDWVGRRAMAHEAVVEQFLGAAAVLPMQLFAIFTSDERVLDYVSRDRRRIDRILTRFEGHVEWGLRLSFDEKAARQAVAGGHRATAPRTARQESGAAYLARKRDLLDVTRGQLAAARSEANRLYRSLSREATEARRRRSTEQLAPGSRLLLDAAFLVPARRAGAFRSALRRQARQLSGAGLVVSLTGPWPPYNFVDTSGPRQTARRTKTPTRPAARGRARR